MSHTVTLPNWWLLIAPCGCYDGMRRAVFEDKIITPSAEAAWEKFTPKARERERERAAGWTVRASRDDETIWLGCTHDPQWTKPEPDSAPPLTVLTYRHKGKSVVRVDGTHDIDIARRAAVFELAVVFHTLGIAPRIRKVLLTTGPAVRFSEAGGTRVDACWRRYRPHPSGGPTSSASAATAPSASRLPRPDSEVEGG